MRIALVTPGFSSSDDDWCIPSLQDLARCLNTAHDVTVYATCYPGRTDSYTVKGIKVRSFGDGKPGRLAWLRRQKRTVDGIAMDHVTKRFDVLHGFWADGGGFVAARCKRRLAIPSVVTVAAGELTFDPRVAYGKARRPVAGRLARYGARHADILAVNSAFHAAMIKGACILPLGVDAERFVPDGDRAHLSGDVPVLAVGSLIPVKNHATMLESLVAARLHVPGIHLHVLGDGQLRSRLVEIISTLNLDDAVTLHGHVPHEALPAYYRAAKFCLLASYFESHAMTVLEAAACGRATVGAAVGSLPDLCAADYLCQPDELDVLARIMVRVATSEQIQEDLSAAAMRACLARFQLTDSLPMFEGAYAQAIAKAAGSR